MDNIEQFQRVKQEAEDYYKTVNAVFCPYLKSKINFNAKGLDHIKMKSWNKSRLVSDQYLRLKFLKLVQEVLKNFGTLQEFHETKNFERIKDTGRWQSIMKPVVYYGFVAILNNVKIKIIVKRVEGGQPYFWSVIPFWKTQRDEIFQKMKKVFHEGDLETQ